MIMSLVCHAFNAHIHFMQYLSNLLLNIVIDVELTISYNARNKAKKLRIIKKAVRTTVDKSANLDRHQTTTGEDQPTWQRSPPSERRIAASESVRNLGVIIDKQLTLDAHTPACSRACFYHLQRIRKIRRFLDDGPLRFYTAEGDTRHWQVTVSTAKSKFCAVAGGSLQHKDWLTDWLTECLYYDIWQTADEITMNDING